MKKLYYTIRVVPIYVVAEDEEEALDIVEDNWREEAENIGSKIKCDVSLAFDCPQGGWDERCLPYGDEEERTLGWWLKDNERLK